MIVLKRDELVFTFPEIHKEAQLHITFQRTLRIPDDDNVYPLPPGLGNFPLRHVDDFGKTVPEQWIEHGGVIMPMYQSEALWINFSSNYLNKHRTEYPFAVKIATGKINAVTGDEWQNRLTQEPQDYLVAPEQPWIDGYCVEKGLIRQFVAMPSGSGYSAEEQLTGKAEHGGLQIIVYPMKRTTFEKLFPEINERPDQRIHESKLCPALAYFDMELVPGGRIKQEIYEDPFEFDGWDQNVSSRCFVHLANSMVWRYITGEEPPTVPFTAKEYVLAGLPWFDYYNDTSVTLQGSEKLNGMKSVAQKGKEEDVNALPDNESIDVEKIILIQRKLAKDQVREASF